jgi:hypothetical protein
MEAAPGATTITVAINAWQRSVHCNDRSARREALQLPRALHRRWMTVFRLRRPAGICAGD